MIGYFRVCSSCGDRSEYTELPEDAASSVTDRINALLRVQGWRIEQGKPDLCGVCHKRVGRTGYDEKGELAYSR